MDAAPISPSPSTEALSLTDRLTGVITGPGEVFAEIRDAPVRVSNWLVPLILATIATVVYVCMAFSQPAIMHGLEEQSAKAIQKRVVAGKMTQAQADQLAPTAAMVMKIAGTASAFVSPAAGLFLMALVLWLVLRFCAGVRLPYSKIVEICGLALVIAVPQEILRSFLVLWKENLLATASPTLFLANPSATNRTDAFLSMFDVVDVWWLAVLTIGLSKAAGVSCRTAGFVAFGVWYGFRIVMVMLVPSQN